MSGLLFLLTELQVVPGISYRSRFHLAWFMIEAIKAQFFQEHRIRPFHYFRIHFSLKSFKRSVNTPAGEVHLGSCNNEKMRKKPPIRRFKPHWSSSRSVSVAMKTRQSDLSTIIVVTRLLGDGVADSHTPDTTSGLRKYRESEQNRREEKQE